MRTADGGGAPSALARAGAPLFRAKSLLLNPAKAGSFGIYNEPKPVVLPVRV